MSETTMGAEAMAGATAQARANAEAAGAGAAASTRSASGAPTCMAAEAVDARRAGAMARDVGPARANAAAVAEAGAAAQDAGSAGANAEVAGAEHGGRFHITFDGARCVKCWACEVACRQWSGLEAAAPARRWVREMTSGVFPQVERVFVSEGCRHCADAPCVAACAFGALEQRPDGRVTMDAAACAGCRRCTAACPFDVPRFTAAGVMDKCDGCWAAGVPAGATPRCVATCPTGALGFKGAPAQPGGPAGSPASAPAGAAHGGPIPTSPSAPVEGGGVAVVSSSVPAPTPGAAGGLRAGESAPAQSGGLAGPPASAPAGVADGAGAAPTSPSAPGEGGGASAPAAGAAIVAQVPEEGEGAPASTLGAAGGFAGAVAESCALVGSLVFREVPVAFLAALRDDPAAAPAPLAPYARSLAGVDLELEAQNLAVDFATVLCGMSPHPVFPYESTYADGDQLLMRPVRDDVVRAYAEAGFAANPALGLPEDHLAFELAFVAHLARREADAREAGDARVADEAAGRRAAFVRDHLARWAPRFADDWARATCSPFYRAVAQVLADLTRAR